MSLAATIDAMVESGCTPEQIQKVVHAHAAEEQRKREMTIAAEEAKREMRRAAAADRQARKRDRDALYREERAQNNAMSRVTACDDALPTVSHGDKARGGAQASERAFVPLSEELPPSPPKGGSAPRRSGGSARGCRLPDEFTPDETTISVGLQLGHSRQHVFGVGLDEFRDYWRGTPGAKGLRSDWQGTYRNRLRATAPRGPRQARAGPGPRSSDGLDEARQLLRDRMNGRDHHEENGRGASERDAGSGAPHRDHAQPARGGREDEDWDGPQLNLVAERAH